MRKLKEPEEQIIELHGSLIALECYMAALSNALTGEARAKLRAEYLRETEVARTVLLNTYVPDNVIDSFERTVKRQADDLARPSR
jgi:hypothetical protein